MSPAGLLGVDIGGTKVALRFEDAEGRSHDHEFAWPAEHDATADLTLLAAQVDDLCTRAGIGAVGVAMPATLDTDGRVVAWPNRPSWTGADPVAVLRNVLPAAVVLCADDGDLAALAEARASGCADLVYVGVGTGVGGGVVVAGRPVPGPGRGSCELGHLVIDRDGPACTCGRRGCVQAVASGPATLRRAAHLRAAEATPDGRPTGPADGVTPDDLRAGLAAGAAWAVTAVDESAAAVATALVGVSELVRPDLGVIGGGFATGIPGYVQTVARHLRSLSRPAHPGPDVRTAVLGARSSLYGAVELARLHA